ncbi:protein cup-like [Ochlerotatus camptorhynchus]|uniref:protein cup-like n=1 Tax=Ochlerotatus camptorhynchus TaxID=644619 RepID=UPI0031DD6C6C
MVKVLSTSLNNMFRNPEQFPDSSHFLMKADDPPLEELDPAILSCGLPAIILSDVQPMYAPPIRYTIDQLLSLRKSALCSRRPLAADDPKVASFSIWRNPSQPNRRGKPLAGNSRKDDKDKGTCDSIGKGQTQERDDKHKHPVRHENGFIGPRFRQNYEFSNRNHHVIVRSYRGEGDNYQMQNNMVEKEPEWVSAGPTSRLDTIELRGFDDDLSNHDGLSVSQSSWGKANSGDAKNSSKHSSGKHISFYDDLHHYEHVVHAKRNDIFLKPHDSSGRENDVESVTTSNTGSPPPARSTPTKDITDCNNLAEDTQKHNGVNVNNFEKFMKFDSLLGSDSATRTSVQSGSRSSKWFRHGNNQSTDSNHDRRQHFFNMTQDNFAGNGNYNRYPFDRSFSQQSRFSSSSSSSYNNSQVDSQNNHPQTDPNSAYRRVMDMIAQSRVTNNQTAQEQYMVQMLNKTQQSEILRRMLIKNTVDNGSDGNQQQQQHQAAQPPRIPTQLELQLHTQSIMQNALLRKKLQDQRRMLLEQSSHLSAMATAPNIVEPNAEVQQFVKSVSPNFQRSLSVLNQTATAGAGHYRSFNQSFPGANSAVNNPLFIGGSNQLDLSASLRQMLLSQQQQGPRSLGNRRRSGKKSVTWKNPV